MEHYWLIKLKLN